MQNNENPVAASETVDIESILSAVEPEVDPFEDFYNAIQTGVFSEETEDAYIFDIDRQQKAAVSKHEFTEAPKAGEKCELLIERQNKQLLWVASHLRAKNLRLWGKIEKMADRKERIEAKIVGCNENGLIVDVLSIRGFVPKRQIETWEVSDMRPYIGKTETFEIVKFDKKDANLILSRRNVIEAEQSAAKEALLKSIAVGQEYDATVRNIVTYGLFVDIGSGVEGLVHRSNLTWGREEPSELYKEGDPIRVKVLEVNPESGKIAFGHKQLTDDPWMAFAKTLEVGQIVFGKVVTLVNFGAFVEIAPGVEALIHNSEMSWSQDARKPLSIDQEVKAKVIGIDLENRKLKLSLKRLEPSPWEEVAQKYPQGTQLTLPISSVADFGIFVKLADGIDGLIHQNDLQWEGKPGKLSDRFKVGDPIDCVVLNIDAAAERASLGIKQMSADPWQEALEKAPLGQRISVVVKHFAKFGAFVEVTPKVDGLIHISELSKERVESIDSVLQKGQTVEATVISIDEKRHRIGLSLIKEPFTVETAEAKKDEEAGDAVDEKATLSENTNATLGDLFPAELKK